MLFDQKFQSGLKKNDVRRHTIFAPELGCRLKADCPLVGPGPKGDVPSVGVFLRDSSPYLREFQRKPRKTLNG